jgi:hypothetical protein
MSLLSSREPGSLILPGDPEFYFTLATPPPNWRQIAAIENNYCFGVDDNGMLKALTGTQTQEYIMGGEMAFRTEYEDLEDIDLTGVEEFYIDY